MSDRLGDREKLAGRRLGVGRRPVRAHAGTRHDQTEQQNSQTGAFVAWERATRGRIITAGLPPRVERASVLPGHGMANRVPAPPGSARLFTEAEQPTQHALESADRTNQVAHDLIISRAEGGSNIHSRRCTDDRCTPPPAGRRRVSRRVAGPSLWRSMDRDRTLTGLVGVRGWLAPGVLDPACCWQRRPGIVAGAGAAGISHQS